MKDCHIAKLPNWLRPYARDGSLLAAMPAKERQRYLYWIKKELARPQWADSRAMGKIYANAARLTIMKGEKYEVDHVIPISHPYVCGLHCEANLQVITAASNAVKSNVWCSDEQLILDMDLPMEFQLELFV